MLIAADLLMPGYIFDPIATEKPPSFATIDEIAATFTVSRTAAAIRTVQRHSLPLVLVMYGQSGRKWIIRSTAADGLWTRKDLHHDSTAMAILFGRAGEDNALRRVPADQWFDGWQAKHFDVRCQSARTRDGVLVLLQLDPKMVAALVS